MFKYLTFTYRMYPNKNQRSRIELNFNACRKIYNVLRAEKILLLRKFQVYEYECYSKQIEINKKEFNSINKVESIPMIKSRFEWLKEADSLALCAEWKNINKAFSNYYSHKCKIPRYKGCKDKNSYLTSNVNCNIRIEKSKIRLPKIGFVKIKIHREMPLDSIIKHVVVKEDKTGKYYVSIVVKYKINEEATKEINNIIGLDFKIGEMYVSSNNTKSNYNLIYSKSKLELDYLMKKMDKKIRHSCNWNKTLLKIRKRYRRVVAKRKYDIYNLANKLAKENDMVCIENLSVKSIAKSLNSGTNIYDTSFYTFTKILKEKLIEQNKLLYKIDKWYPSSKMCSKCGNIKEDLQLEDRIYTCINCGLIIDRDKNAAINIKNVGIEKNKNENK